MEKLTIAVIQARTGSTRFKGKVLQDLMGQPLLLRMLERVKKSKKINKIIVATTTSNDDDVIVDLCKQADVEVFRGSEKNVLERYFKAVAIYPGCTVVRLTSDCPLIDPILIDKVISEFELGDFSYVSNTIKPTFPDGLDVEVFSYDILVDAYQHATTDLDKEHVTQYIIKNNKNIKNYTGEDDCSKYRWTVDYPDDLELVRKIYEHFYPVKPDFTYQDVLEYLSDKPELTALNKKHVRNEMLIER